MRKANFWSCCFCRWELSSLLHPHAETSSGLIKSPSTTQKPSSPAWGCHTFPPASLWLVWATSTVASAHQVKGVLPALRNSCSCFESPPSCSSKSCSLHHFTYFCHQRASDFIWLFQHCRGHIVALLLRLLCLDLTLLSQEKGNKVFYIL